VNVGFRIELRDERGSAVRDLPDPAGGTFDAAGGFDELVPEDDDLSFPLLRCVDRYGDTVFNRSQMPDLLAEVERLAISATQPGAREGLERLRVIAERCRDGTHLYVWFIGD
jgi:hypothetical protein